MSLKVFLLRDLSTLSRFLNLGFVILAVLSWPCLVGKQPTTLVQVYLIVLPISLTIWQYYP